MMENNEVQKDSKAAYRELVNQMGKKEFTLLKMQEYGFWPKDLPTPYEIQKGETPEQFEKKQGLLKNYQKIIDQIAKLYEERDDINKKLRELAKKYDQTWDYERIRKDIAQSIMEESKARRAERKKQRIFEKQQRTLEWQNKKAQRVIHIGKGFSSQLKDIEGDDAKLTALGLPLIHDDKELGEFLGLSYQQLRFLTYHRDVVTVDHYHRFAVKKRNGGLRSIAAPKTSLKSAQRRILEGILNNFECSKQAHGFIKGRSVVSGAQPHLSQPVLLINMDIEDFFPTITFERVLGMFKSFGYSAYVSSLLSLLCTYCERMPIEVKGKIRYVKTSNRILPQGSPASPMITNVLCRNMDKRLDGLAKKYGFTYTRYADDMSFSTNGAISKDEGKFCGLVSKIVKDEGFQIKKAKTRYLRKNNRQIVTGVVVNNQEAGVPKKWIKRFRAAIYNANKLKSSGTPITDKTKNQISGMAAWLKSVNANRYEAIISEALKVIEKK